MFFSTRGSAAKLQFHTTRGEIKKHFQTHPSSAGLINLSQFAQVLWYLILVRLRHRLHILQVGISGVTPGGHGEARGQLRKKDAWDAKHVRDSFTIQTLVYAPDELLL